METNEEEEDPENETPETSNEEENFYEKACEPNEYVVGLGV